MDEMKRNKFFPIFILMFCFCIGLLLIANCAANQPPNSPKITGPAQGTTNTSYTFTALTTDSDNDTISYTFDWDDRTELTITDFLRNGTSSIQNHSWTQAGRYDIIVTVMDANNETTQNTTTIYIDSHLIKDEITGYLIDADGDGIYDLFYDETLGEETQVQQDTKEHYFIDLDGDGNWDYQYDPTTESIAAIDYEQSNMTSIDIPWTLIIIIINALIIISAIVFFYKKGYF